MKKLLIGALMLTSLSSFAQQVRIEENPINPVLHCISSNPQVSLRYNFQEKILETKEYSLRVVTVEEGVEYYVSTETIVVEDEWGDPTEEKVPSLSLKGSDGKVIIKFLKDGMGNDGASGQEYDYSLDGTFHNITSMGCNIVEGN